MNLVRDRLKMGLEKRGVILTSLMFLAFIFSTPSPYVNSTPVNGGGGGLEPKGVILETLISVDDGEFREYNPLTGNGTVAKIIYREAGYREFTSLIKDNFPPPSGDYFFRYLTGLPVVNTSAHWFLFFKHTLKNTGDVNIENARLDGWHAYVIDENGNEFTSPRVLWRLYKYESKAPSSIMVGETVNAVTSYQIHKIPSLRTMFIFSFLSSDAVLDTWAYQGLIGKEVVRFTGFNYSLPRLELRRFKPGSIILTPPETIEYEFTIANRMRDSSLNASIQYKFAQTVTWEINLWVSAHQGLIGSQEVSLKPLETWSKRLVTEFPADKDDHAVHVYFGVLLISGKEPPPLLGEVWETLYGANSYLGVTAASTKMAYHEGRAYVELSFNLVPYVSPASMDVMPYEYNFTITVYDQDYNQLIYGPVRKSVDIPIRKGEKLRVTYNIPVEELKQGWKIMVQVDTYRVTEMVNSMNYARVSVPSLLSLPDLSVNSEGVDLYRPMKPGVENVAICRVRNLGISDVKDVRVELLVDDEPVGLQNASVQARSETIVNFYWTPSGDAHKVKVVVDPENAVYEMNEGNNEAERIFSSSVQIPPMDYRWIIPAVVAAVALVFLWLRKLGRTVKLRENL